MTILAVLFLAGLWAGAQNALAGGGSFVSLPALIFAGLDAKTANIASCIALFPGQVASGLGSREMLQHIPELRYPSLAWISLVGGAAGAALLLFTSTVLFDRLVPWLVLIATAIFAWGSLSKENLTTKPRIVPRVAVLCQGGIAVYGGYFSGGMGFLMMALLTAAGLGVRAAGAAKNILSVLINAAAVLLFTVTTRVPVTETVALGAGAVVGGLWGVWVLARVDERLLRSVIVVLGAALFVGLLARSN